MDLEIENSKIDQVKELAKEAETQATEAGIQVPGAKAGKKRGPYKKKSKTEKSAAGAGGAEKQDQAPPDKGPEIPTSALLAPFIAGATVAIANRLEIPEARATPAEVASMSQALGMLADKWLPGVLDKYGIEAMCFVALSQYGIRVWNLSAAKRAHEARVANGPGFHEKHSAFDPPGQSEEPKAERVVRDVGI